MAFIHGTLIGVYEIQSLIDTGGMGEVYRATDTNLGRDVAIKVLPAELAADAERGARFRREARTLAALNHPHVATLYGWEPLDSAFAQAGATMLVMELVEGPTLETKLTRGALPLAEVVRIGSQIADALAAAHEQGIVHRDLKPANIKLTRSGAVKVLDFGIAKAIDEALTAGTVTATGAAQILGTPAYMSPEQARGQIVDARTDVWAFGCVLVEMLTGRRPFDGATTSDVVAAVLARDPDWSLVPTNTPAGLRQLIQRCLQKDTGERFRSMADARMILADLATTGVSAVPATAPRPGLLAATAIVTVAVTALTAWGWTTHSSRATEPVELPPWQKLTFRQGYVHNARISADGQTVVYSAAWDGQPLKIFSTTTVSPESRPIEVPPSGLLAVSPTGRLAVSLSCRFFPASTTCLGTLAQVPLAGGGPRALAHGVVTADWGGGDELAAVRDVNGRFVVEFPLGTRVAANAHGHVRVWRGGRRLAWTETAPGPGALPFVMVRDEASIRVAGSGWRFISGLAWAPDGDALYVSGYRRGEIGTDDVTRLGLDGSQARVLRSGDRLRVLDVASDGRLLVDRASSKYAVTLRPLRNPTEASRDLTWLGSTVADALSADGTKLLFTERGPSATLDAFDIALRPTDGGPVIRLGTGAGHAISDDGRWALTTSRPDSQGFTDLVLYPLGPGTARTLERPAGLTLAGQLVGGAVAADFVDHSRVIVRARKESGPWQTYVQPIDGGPPALLTHEPGFIISPMSPDGSRFVSRRDDGSIWIASVAPRDALPLPVKLAPNQLVIEWTADGQGLFIMTRNIGFFTVTRMDLATGRETKVTDVHPQDRAGFDSNFSRGVLVTPDGSTLVVTESRILSDLFLVGRAR